LNIEAEFRSLTNIFRRVFGIFVGKRGIAERRGIFSGREPGD